MAQATQFQFTHQELAKMMIREQGITDGLWFVGFNMNFMAANTDMAGKFQPVGAIGISSVTLCKSDVETPLTVDASTVFPDSIPV